MLDPPPAYTSAGGAGSSYGTRPEKGRGEDDDRYHHLGKNKGKSCAHLPLQLHGPQYAELVITGWDGLVFVNFPSHLRDGLESVIANMWSPGVSQHHTYPNGFEWRLGGLQVCGKAGVLLAKRLLIHLAHYLAQQGWQLACGGRVAIASEDKHTLFFRKGEPADRSFCAISFMDIDKIQLIDSPTQSIKADFLRAVHTWPLGIHCEKTKEFGCFQITFRGKPWSLNAQSLQARKVRLDLLSAMDKHGYELAACIATRCPGVQEQRSDGSTSRVAPLFVMLSIGGTTPEVDQSADTWLLASRM